jgi:hypothetical protein
MNSNLNAALNTAVYVTLPNFKPGRITYSSTARDWFVNLVEINPANKKLDTIRFRGHTPDLLKKAILRQSPQAVFSSTNPDSAVDPLKIQSAEIQDQREPHTIEVNGRKVNEIDWALEILRREYGQRDPVTGVRNFMPGQEFTIEMCRKNGIRDKVFEAIQTQMQNEFAGKVTDAHRSIESELSPKDIERHTGNNLISFTNECEFGGWVEWFKQHPGFLLWPDNSGHNRSVLLDWCRQRGYAVPRHPELSQGMVYLLEHNHFCLQPSYKRSEKYLKDQVRPFTREESASESVSQSDINRAVTALTAKYGAPLKVSIERLNAVGIPNAERVYEALQARYSPNNAKGKSSAELKTDLQAMRNASGPRSRRSNQTGY